MQRQSLYRHGFARLAACTIQGVVADPAANAARIGLAATLADEAGAALAVFPELGLSGYAIDDLLLQDALLADVHREAAGLIAASRGWGLVLVVGAPLRHGARLYNCALVIHRGQLLGVVPKSYLPTYREFYEARHFASGALLRGARITVGGHTAPFGTDLIFAADDLPDFRLGVEICEDLWLPVPPSSGLALAGASILANLSASPVTVGRAAARQTLIQAQSLRCLAAYLYVAAGAGESTTDLSWDGQASIYENGALLRDAPRFTRGTNITLADVDLDLLRQERMRMGTFQDNACALPGNAYRTVAFSLNPKESDLGLERDVPRFPFVPADRARLDQDCYEAWNIQVSGLVQRLSATGAAKAVIGVSGGLDSTHALIICAKAMDLLGRKRSDILAYTMPGFATSDATRANAHGLMRVLGVSAHELDIRPAAKQVLADLDHPFARGEAVYDVTFENVQAGLRTDYLFRLANRHNGIVIGTGDLSELALGWCTFGVGDQMAHYSVNAGIPKTLIQHVIRWAIAHGEFGADAARILEAVLATDISPELVPGETLQSTEAKIGPYALQDFNLFYTLRHGFLPSKIAFLADHAWGDAGRGHWPPGFPNAARNSYAPAEIRHWLRVFINRFFAFSQFKRSTLPNGPKVVAGGSLSPRGDWRAPSDGNAAAWLRDLDADAQPQSTAPD